MQFFPYFLWQPRAEAVSPPGGSPPAPAGLVLALHDGRSGDHILDIRQFAFCQIAWSDKGPDTGTIGVPRSSAVLLAQHIIPGGVPPFVRIVPSTLDDDRGEPWDIDPWIGRLTRPQGSNLAAVWTLQLEGPASWLSEYTLPPSWPRTLPGARLAAWSMAVYPEARVSAGRTAHSGPGVPASPGGQTLMDLWTKTADERGETMWLSADPDQIALYLDWSHPLARRDRRGEVILQAGPDGGNCTWDPTYSLWKPARETVMAGWSADQGSTVLARGIRRAPGNVYGRGGATGAPLQAPAVRQIAGLPTTYQPGLATSREIELALAARTRANMVPSEMARVTITRPRSRLYSLRPGDLVRCMWTDEPTGVFRDATALVLAKTVQLAPTLSCEYGLEVWS